MSQQLYGRFIYITEYVLPISLLSKNKSKESFVHVHWQWRTQEFCLGGVQQIQLRTEDRENGDLEAVAP